MDTQQRGTERPAIIAVPEAQEAGAIIWWRLAGEINADDLAFAWESAGLDEKLLPGVVTPGVALRRAVMRQKMRSRWVHPLKGGGWALTDATENADEEVDYNLSLRARVDQIGGLVMKPADHLLVPRVRADYNHFLGTLIGGDISQWMTRLMYTLHAVSLRDTGGVYFVQRGDAIIRWRKMVVAIRAISNHAVFEVPALKSDEAVTAILDAVAREAETALESMRGEMGDRDLKEKALDNRIDKCEELLGKLGSYESLLGVGLEGVQSKVNEMKANLSAAMLVAASKADGGE